jgi:phosphoglycolate phosphatase-like HAD superfamily hydrolase
MLNHEQISKRNVIYVGDETRDIEASKKAGIPVIAVTWGLNDREILAMAQPDQIIDSPDNLLACIKQILNDHFT